MRSIRSSRRGRVALVLLAALALAAASCDGDADVEVEDEAASPTPGPTVTVTADPEGSVADFDPLEANIHDTLDVSGRDSIRMEVDDFYFEPTVLFGDPGQTIEIRLANDGTLTHTFTLEDQQVDVSLLPDATASAEVTIPEEGAAVFVCRFHLADGMQGAVGLRGAIDLPGDDLDED